MAEDGAVGTRTAGSFGRVAAAYAAASVLGALAFAAVFVVLVWVDGVPRGVEGLWRGLLIVGALLFVALLVGAYERLRAADEGLALLTVLLGVAGAVGGLLHGGTQLAAAITPARDAPDLDPRGILRYGVTGLAMLALSWLAARGGAPRAVVLLSAAGGALLVFIYAGLLGELITPTDRPTLVPPILYGFVVAPLWLAAVARWLWAPDGASARVGRPKWTGSPNAVISGSG
jgi:hypothetical protein